MSVNQETPADVYLRVSEIGKQDLASRSGRPEGLSKAMDLPGGHHEWIFSRLGG